MRALSPFALALLPVGVVVVVGVTLIIVRAGGEHEPTPGLTAEATLATQDGAKVGVVRFEQSAGGVLIMAEIEGLPPGGHAFTIHEFGACTPDFAAAGDHFNPTDAEDGLIHSSWRRGEAAEAHRGDLPNIYAASDGSARADFFTDGITLDVGPGHSVFDADGSAIIVHEWPDTYEAIEPDTGQRLACGVITPT